MPLKRKATDAIDNSPSKHVAITNTNIFQKDTPSRQTRSGTLATSLMTTPKVRRTYGKQTDSAPEVAKPPLERTSEVLDLKLKAIVEISSPTKTIHGRKKQINPQESPSKRSSKRTKTTDNPPPQLIETPHRIKRTYSKKVVVEVPAPPTSKAKPLVSPLPKHTPSSKNREAPITPNSNNLRPSDLSSPSRTQSLLVCKQLPSEFHTCLNAQKKAVLRVLHTPSKLFCDDEENDAGKSPKRLLEAILNGTVIRSEGNSCLLLGPRGSGKSTILDQCLRSLPEAPIIIHLSGWIHHTDRLAMREIAYQLGQQTGKSFLPGVEEDNTLVDQDDNPFLDHRNPEVIETGLSLPPPSHLPALISVIPTLSRPTVIILDAFDLFTLHPRQALLYCLLDTVQGCRTIAGNKGLAVIGLTTRIDTINLLEKRVKSRFSGRVIRTSSISTSQGALSLIKSALYTPITDDGDDHERSEEWNKAWSKRVNECLDDRELLDSVKDTIGVVKDSRLLLRTLICVVTRLSPDIPFPTPSLLSQAIVCQRSRPSPYDPLDLPYPSICLLIASSHYAASGHDVFTFEMLFSTFRNQVRASVAAPIQVNGGSIGMVRCSKAILLGAFEHLISSRIFVAAASLSNMTKEFARYRTTLEREDVKKVIERTGQVMLKKWFNKAE